jgi:23S rRNA pseudouridine1911/1915/1917 synthase
VSSFDELRMTRYAISNMSTTSFTTQSSQRLDQCVAEALGCSRSQAVTMIKKGLVHVEERKITKPSKKIEEGVMLRIDMHKHTPKKSVMVSKPVLSTDEASNHDTCTNSAILRRAQDDTNPPIPILYEDESCIVVDKPAGITVHPGAQTNDPTLIEMMRAQTNNADLHLVHRLDKETTGCLLIAKGTKALEQLQRQFKNRTVQKTYLAVVHGVPKEKKATINAPIGRSLMNRVKMSLFRTSTSRDAVTEYEVIDQAEDCALLRCTIHTGRTHQIRVHLAGIGHPIVGDGKYGKKGESGPLMLHAETLTFKNGPGEDVSVSSNSPDTLRMPDSKI